MEHVSLHCTMVNASKQSGYPTRSYRPPPRRWNRHFGARAWTYWNRVGLMWWLAGSRMARKAVAREDLYEAVRREVGLSPHECKALVEQVLDQITDCLARGGGGEALRAWRIHRAPKEGAPWAQSKTGEPALFSARRVPSFSRTS
jgi:integration host factor subunit alpha